MKIKSLTEVGNQYEFIFVEIHFLPGLPQIHFLGRADSHLKESALRIRSAFQTSGFQFPMTQKIVVNLTPSHIKKMSSGMELAVAVGILQMTEQIKGLDFQNCVVFGELSLSGEVKFPPLSRFVPVKPEDSWLSGPGFEKYASGLQIHHLKALTSPQWVEKRIDSTLKKPPFTVNTVSKRQARALEILSVGEHHALVAGAQGSGKTLLTELLISLLPHPSAELLQFHEAHFGQVLSWVPVARPHHTLPPLSMVGGGVPPRPGEITRAHGGLLFLDEMFEFKPATLEVMREALSSQKVTVSRGQQSKSFPADFQLVGTTNLCPCGKWTPGKLRTCSYNERRCRSILQKLSGPLMDRVQGIVYFEDKGEEHQIPITQVEKQILKTREFQKQQNRKNLNRNWTENDLSAKELKLWQDFQDGFNLSSVRRRQAMMGWARTLADLQGEPEIQKEHLQNAYADCVLALSQLLSH